MSDLPENKILEKISAITQEGAEKEILLNLIKVSVGFDIVDYDEYLLQCYMPISTGVTIDLDAQSFVVCPKCDKKKATPHVMSFRAADEGMVVVLMCTNCTKTTMLKKMVT